MNIRRFIYKAICEKIIYIRSNFSINIHLVRSLKNRVLFTGAFYHVREMLYCCDPKEISIFIPNIKKIGNVLQYDLAYLEKLWRLKFQISVSISA